MSKVLFGADVASAIMEGVRSDVALLASRGITPRLAIIRAGERADEMSYERGALKRCEAAGVAVSLVTLCEDALQSELIAAIHRVNGDDGIHGALLLRPLPPQIDDYTVRNVLDARKDIDGITDAAAAGVFTASKQLFMPCTPHACMEVLDHYGIAVEGKKAVVIGRSLVIGKPIAMMLLDRNATVCIAHSRTADLKAVVREADIVVCCIGQAEMIDASYLTAGQVVVDVGINVGEDGKLTGDVKYSEAEAVVAAITPVPGGVGSVTTSVLAKHVVQAALRQARLG
jgi:methylenetetrahydrofolate dehydrogenase (NADP+)/methenyltetrahydrofolate cyclohydrolase